MNGGKNTRHTASFVHKNNSKSNTSDLSTPDNESEAEPDYLPERKRLGACVLFGGTAPII
jgi:hypothetical protein